MGSMEFSPWALAGDFLGEEGSGVGKEWNFSQQNYLSFEELHQVRIAALSLREFVGRVKVLEDAKVWQRPRALWEFIKSYRKVFSGVDDKDRSFINQALSHLNSAGQIIGLVETFSKSIQARLAMGVLNYAIIAAGIKFPEFFDNINAWQAIGVNVLAALVLSAVEYKRLEEGEWIISAGAQGLRIAGVSSLLSLVLVRANTLARNLSMALIPDLQPAAFLSGLGILFQVVLQGGVRGLR